jgi:serine protease AprX
MVLFLVYLLYRRNESMKNIMKPLQLILAFVMIASLLGSVTVVGAVDNTQVAVKAHPLLVQMAAEQPEQVVSVIVQKMAKETDLEAKIARLGGVVTKDLHIINAFAAEISTKAALELARNDGVRWISPDGPVERTGKPVPMEVFTVRDDFEFFPIADEFGNPLVVSTYSNNDGTVAWKTDWLEEDVAGDGPMAGNIQIVSGMLMLHDNPDTGSQPSIERTVDLSDGVTSAMLSFSFLFGPETVAGEDTILLEISNDGGLTYRIAGTYSSNGGVSGSSYQNILTDASPDTRLRFRVTSGFDGPGDYFALGYIQIEYEGNSLPGNTFLSTLSVPEVWGMGLDGAGIGVAVIDSGITKDQDFGKQVQVQKSFNPNSNTVLDVNGHGTHVAGIIAMNGDSAGGFYSGIAPGVNLLSLKVSDEVGMAYESDVVEAIQWVYDNKDTYNIRVVNLSINSTVHQSYHTSPLDAAVEILWFDGVVVVASVGNIDESNGWESLVNAPADDPFVITVGAADEKGSTRRRDDVLASFSINDETYDGYLKPDIVAPGKNIVSVLAASSDWDVIAPERVVAGNYFCLSGTSMAAPMVTSAVALLLQDEPNLTPDQVKYRLINTAPDTLGNIPYLDVYEAVTGTTSESANTGLIASQLLWGGDEPVAWGSVAWNSVAWNSVAWNSVAWNSVAWNSVAWNSVAWNE